MEISVLSCRIGEISLVIWKFLFSEITGYIKARPWLELMITVYYPTLIARICGWMSADLFNHIIHVSFTAYPFFFLYAVYTRCFREINYAVLETERYTLPGIIYNFITHIFLIHYQNPSNIPILWYIKRDALESGNIGYKSVKLTKAKNRTFSYREVAFPPLLIFHRIISGGVNCIHYQQGTKVLFSSMFIPELRGSADNDNSSWCFAPVCVCVCARVP